MKTNSKRPLPLVFSKWWILFIKKSLPKYFNFVLYRDGKHWKDVRSALGKQTIPRNVQTFHEGYNNIIHRFTKYIKSSRMEDGAMNDISLPFRRLLVECKFVSWENGFI